MYLNNPSGIDAHLRKRSIDIINEVNRREYKEIGDPEILSRISQYELAFRMQAEVPKVMDISQEPTYIHEMYGTKPGKISFANNCLLARRLVEQGDHASLVARKGYFYRLLNAQPSGIAA